MTMSPSSKVEKSPTSTVPTAQRPRERLPNRAGLPVAAQRQVVREDAGGGIAAGVADRAAALVVPLAAEAADPSKPIE